MRTLSLTALLLLALSGCAALAVGHWLGLFTGPGVRLEFTRPVLLVAADQGVREAALRAGLQAAGMDATGALLRRSDQWPTQAPFPEARLGIEVTAAAARHRERLPSALRLDRTAGGLALHATLPDRGRLTRSVAWPVLQWQLKRLIDEGSHVPGRLLLREDGSLFDAWVELEDLDRDETAPAVAVPALVAPVLP